MSEMKTAYSKDIREHYFKIGKSGHVIGVRPLKELRELLSGKELNFTHIKIDGFKKQSLGKPIPGEMLESAIKQGRLQLRITPDQMELVDPGNAVDQLKSRFKKLELLKVALGTNNYQTAADSTSSLTSHVESSNVFSESLSNVAARMIEYLILHSGDEPKVCFGGGRTMGEVATHVSGYNLVNRFHAYALNYANRTATISKKLDSPADSSAVTNHIFNMSRDCLAHLVPMPPLPQNNVRESAEWHSLLFYRNHIIRDIFEESKDADIVFLGVGDFRENSPTISHLSTYAGIDSQALSRFQPILAGDINFSFFDENGDDQTREIFKQQMSANDVFAEETETLFKDDFCHPFLAALNVRWLVDRVKNRKKVVAIAGGPGGLKAEALFPLLDGGVINGLITDIDTLNKLYEIS